MEDSCQKEESTKPQFMPSLKGHAAAPSFRQSPNIRAILTIPDDSDATDSSQHSSSHSTSRSSWHRPPSRARICIGKVLYSSRFDLIMGIVIFGNILVMVQETDNDARCVGSSPDKCEKMFFVLVNQAFLFIYLVEGVLRLYVLRFEFFAERWNWLDLIIVICGYIDMGMSFFEKGASLPGPSMSLLRIFRVLRLSRVIRVLRNIPELFLMMRCFISALQSMFWGILLINLLLMVFAIMCVELVHPISVDVLADDYECQDAFSSVWKCMLLFFQTLVAGDSWGRCTLPIIYEEPYLFILFGSALACVQLGFMNLILAVIVERATEARERVAKENMKEKEKQEIKSANILREIFRSIDSDDSGTISLEELLQGWETNADMKYHLATMDIEKGDLGLIFELMDSEQKGELSYQYLIDKLRMTVSQDLRKHLFMLRLQASEITKEIRTMQEVHREDPRGTLSGIREHSELKLQSSSMADPDRGEFHKKPLDSSSFEKEMLSLRMRLDEQHEVLMAAVSHNSTRTTNGAPGGMGNSMISLGSRLAWEPAKNPGCRTINDLRLEVSRLEGGGAPGRLSKVPSLDDKVNYYGLTEASNPAGAPYATTESKSQAQSNGPILGVSRGDKTGEVSL